MGSIMAALMPPPQPQRYNERDIYNACYYGNLDELDKALRQKPALDVNRAKPDTGVTAACVSAQQGHDTCLHRLILHGADIRKADKDGWAPIHIACQNGRHACLTLLANNGVDVNVPVAPFTMSSSMHSRCLHILA